MGEKEVEKIEPKRMYFLYEVHKLGLVPSVKSFVTLRGFVERKQLKATVYNTGANKRTRRYFVLGENLIDFIEKFQTGTLKK